MTENAQTAAQARTVFTDLTQRLLALVEQHIGMPLWHGLRVVAADATFCKLCGAQAVSQYGLGIRQKPPPRIC